MIPDNLVPLVINDVRNKRQAREGSEVYGVKRKRVVYSIPGQFAPLVINDTQEEEEEEGGCAGKRELHLDYTVQHVLCASDQRYQEAEGA